MKVEKVIEEVPAKTLELVVTNKSVGFLETNISALEEYVEEKLKEYEPENYMGDADLAKKDRAELNKAKDKIARARKDLITELMKPYEDFEDRCKALEKKIDNASGLLDEIVKVKENEEKESKRKKIALFWETKNFTLFPVDKIFNPKWLNKTYKESDILDEMDAIIERTYKDLKVIERYSDDAKTLKAHYLMNLDIAETIQYGDELQRQKEIAQKELEGRENREHEQKIRQQEKELYQEEKQQGKDNLVSNLVDEALGIVSKPQKKEFVVTVKCLDEELLKLKAAMNALGIEFSVQELTF